MGAGSAFPEELDDGALAVGLGVVPELDLGDESLVTDEIEDPRLAAGRNHHVELELLSLAIRESDPDPAELDGALADRELDRVKLMFRSLDDEDVVIGAIGDGPFAEENPTVPRGESVAGSDGEQCDETTDYDELFHDVTS